MNELLGKTRVLLLAPALLALACAAQERAELGPTAAASLAPRGQVRSRDGTLIAYESAGNGPALILVSAALSDRGPTRALGALLAERCTVVQYDRRGRGESGDAEAYAVEREVEDLAALIAAAGGRAALFGHSSGAVLALEAASRLGARVPSVVLYEPPFVLDSSRPPVPADFTERVRALVAEGHRGDAVAYFFEDAVGVPPEFVREMRTMPMWAGMEALAHTLAYDGALVAGTQAGEPLPTGRWTEVQAAALVLVGGESPPWLHRAAQSLAERLPCARLDVLAGADHSAAVMAPRALAPLVLAHVAP